MGGPVVGTYVLLCPVPESHSGVHYPVFPWGGVCPEVGLKACAYLGPWDVAPAVCCTVEVAWVVPLLPVVGPLYEVLL